MIFWDVYQISSKKQSLHGIMLRGRIRKFAIENEIDCLVENTNEIKNTVRFAVKAGENIESINRYLQSILVDVSVALVLESVKNPVLSKLKVNQEERYIL